MSSKAMKRNNRQETNHQEWYAGFRFREVPMLADPPQPGTPHSLFQKTFVDDASLMQVHQHVNGLCVITAGTALLQDNNSDPPTSIEFQVEELPDSLSSQQKKRKHDFSASAKQPSSSSSHHNNNKKKPGFVTPSDTLLKVEKADGTFLHLPCCVLGRVVELNQLLSPDVLYKDALLKGYLAVISPQGSFPPTPPPPTDEG
jgi:hypothetical protein